MTVATIAHNTCISRLDRKSVSPQSFIFPNPRRHDRVPGIGGRVFCEKADVEQWLNEASGVVDDYSCISNNPEKFPHMPFTDFRGVSVIQ